jgi:hypothetical protein
LDENLPDYSLGGIDECRFNLLWEMEIPAQSAQTVKAIVEVDGYGSDRFHRIVADAEQGQHKIDLFYGDGVFLVDVVKGDCAHNEDREHEQSDIVESGLGIK